VQQSINAAVPLAVVGLARHASTEGRARVLLDGIEDRTYPYVEPGELDVILDNPAGTEALARSSEAVVQRLFGSKRDGLIDALAAHAGVSRASASKQLALVTALVVGIVRHQVRSSTLDARGVSRYLADQERAAAPSLPAPVVGLLGTTPTLVPDASSRVPERYTGSPRAPASAGAYPPGAPRSGVWKWLPWLVAAVAAILLISFAFNRKPQRFEPMSRPVTDENARPAEPPGAPESASPLRITLSPATAAETLASYFAGTEPAPHRFVLEGVEFDIGQASVVSNRTLEGVATALLAHPSARIRVEAHTDTVGTPSTNETLTQAQAEAVKGYLVQRGVTAASVDAVGLGDRQPLASNETAEGRDRNRRVEIVVIQR
jgi:outer membrane protein OmpA-like peptidoglycan-associated protein